MEDFDATVRELTRQIEERQKALQLRLASERRGVVALQNLLERVQAAPDAFDEEDVRAVQRAVATREEALKALQQDAERQESVRREKEALLLQLHRTMQQRSALLDAADAETGVLSQHEGLLKFFAEKQLNLASLLKAKMRDLVPALGQ